MEDAARKDSPPPSSQTAWPLALLVAVADLAAGEELLESGVGYALAGAGN